MLFEDGEGKILMVDDIDELAPWEIEERQIHVYEEFEDKMSLYRDFDDN